LYDNNSAIGLSLRVVFSFVVVVGLSARWVYEKIPVFVVPGRVVHIICWIFAEIHRSQYPLVIIFFFKIFVNDRV
jgi:hypothetical protein